MAAVVIHKFHSAPSLRASALALIARRQVFMPPSVYATESPYESLAAKSLGANLPTRPFRVYDSQYDRGLERSCRRRRTACRASYLRGTRLTSNGFVVWIAPLRVLPLLGASTCRDRCAEPAAGASSRSISIRHVSYSARRGERHIPCRRLERR